MEQQLEPQETESISRKTPFVEDQCTRLRIVSVSHRVLTVTLQTAPLLFYGRKALAQRDAEATPRLFLTALRIH